MVLDPQAKYPSRRTYVVKLRRDASPDALAGRLENVLTGEQREFESGDRLLDSLASDIEASTSERSVDGVSKP